MYLLWKKLYLAMKCFSFAENDNAMSTRDFEQICTLICSGEVENIMNVTDDNVFYEEFGMSCLELIELIGIMRC